MTRIVLPYPPSANVYWRSERGRVHRSARANEYKLQVGLMCNLEGLTPVTGEVCVRLDFYRPRRSGDLDNLLKVTLDALIGYAYWDDAQVTEIHARRGDDKADPRVEVVIQELA